MSLTLRLGGRVADGTVTGNCECVSAIGPLLGGGHSMLQARHGFVADSLVSARVVLADGSAVDASADQHPDLFWALRGAGHNLGVVTSFDVRTYDARAPWSMTTLSFTHDKVEALFDTWNALEDGRKERGLLVPIAIMARNDTLDADHVSLSHLSGPQMDAPGQTADGRRQAIINLQLFSEGETAVGRYAVAFRALGPAADQTASNIPWGDVFVTAGLGRDSPVCRKDFNLLFSDLTADTKFAQSIFVLESYGWQGVEAVPEGQNAAAPEERRRHIMSPITWWAGADAADRSKAERYCRRMRRAVRGAEPPHAYVNYAVGNEGLDEVYGRDEARLARLRRVKRQYDGDGRFSFYMPIQ